MDRELILGVLVLLGLLWFQTREGMATGVFDASKGMPEPEQVSDIFDQIMSMAAPVLQQGYAEALAFAQETFVEAKALAVKYPDDTNLTFGINFAKDSDHIVELSKVAVVYGVLGAGDQVKRTGGSITETSLHAAIDPLYATLNQHINDAVPPFKPPPNMSSAEAAELKPKVTEYAEKARALVKKYDTPEVRDALVALLKAYFVDQLVPSPVSDAADAAAKKVAANAQVDGAKVDSKVVNAQTMYQSSRLRQDVSKMIDDFMSATPSPRQPTTGTPDAPEVKERTKILTLQAKHLYVIQAALLTVLLCVLAFLLMPMWAAQMSSILILATGIAAAIYLSQIQ